MEVLDQILFEKMGFHIVEPYSSTIVEATAKPALYFNSSIDQSLYKDRSMSSALPKASRYRSVLKEEENG